MSRHYAACDRRLSMILASLPESASHLVLCGPYLPAASMREWLDEGGAQVWRCETGGAIQARAGEVRIGSMAGWIGPDWLHPGTAQDLHRRLAAALSRAFAVDRVSLVTPAVCGMTLWRETARDVPILTDEQQQLIRSTTCQRRDQPCLTLPALRTVPEIQVWDGRVMYAALLRALPIGPAETVGPLPDLPPDFRGRVRVGFRVPPSWTHVGLLAAPGFGRAWDWPSEPGETGETWCDAAEARYALSQGWEVSLLGGLRLSEGRPLDSWARRLLGLWERSQGEPLLARCLRAVILQTIGDFQGAGRVEEQERGWIGPRSAPMPVMEEIRHSRTGARAATAHPEWCAAIWSRCRLRMVKAMLSLPRESILACRTDALYLAGDPGWEDDGKIGRLRRKGTLPGPLPAPRTEQDLNRLLGSG